VKTGTYTVSPIISSEEKDKGLKLIPSEKNIVVEGAPVLDLKFSQTQLSLSGKVSCLQGEEKKCSEADVQLINKGKLVSSQKIDEKGEYTFEKVLPGKYQVKI